MASDATAFVHQLNFQARDAANESAALGAAWRLGLVDRLRAGPGSLAELSERLNAAQRGVRCLVEILLGLRFVEQGSDGFQLSADLRDALADDAYREGLSRASSFWERSTQLEQAVRVQGDSAEVLEWYRSQFLGTGPSFGRMADDFYDRLARNFLRTQAIIVASRLGILKSLTAGERPLQELSQSLGVSDSGLRTLAEILQTLSIVSLNDSHLSFSTLAARCFDPRSLPYFERALPATMVYWEGLGRLDEAVRDGRFVLDLKDPKTAERVYGENSSRITGIFVSHLKLGRHAVPLVKQMRSLTGAKVLDVGTGSGVWGAAFAESDPTLQVTYLDSERVLATVRKNLVQVKLLDRAELWAADCTTADLGERRWDIILLPQILPVLQPKQRAAFFRRVARGLALGGVVAVSGYVMSDRRDGPADALYFSLRRYMTNEGDVLSFGEMQSELADVGLTAARLFPLPVQELVLATRGDLPWPESASELRR